MDAGYGILDTGYWKLHSSEKFHFFMGIGFGTFSSMGQVVAIQGVAKNRIGVATSTFLAVSELGIGIGPFLLGNMVPWLGFRNLYLLVGIVVLAALLMYHMMQSKTKTTVSEVTR